MQTIKEAFDIYFKKLLSAWDSKFSTLPTVCYEEDLSKVLIVGELDEDEMIQWQPKKLSTENNLSEKIQSLLSPHVIDYFTSYYFFSTGGKYQEYSIELNQITPEFLKNELENCLEEYMKFHNGTLDYVPIGIESKSSLLVVLGNSANDKGVYLEDHEESVYDKISNDLSDFISNLNP